jgi:integrase
MLRDLDAYFDGRSAGSISQDEAQEWINSRITPKRSARTVANTWKRAAHTVFAWAKTAKLIGSNPFATVTVTRPAKVVTRENKAFTSTEARTILSAAFAVEDTRKPLEAAKRWLPWLCAYSGARPGEVAQLRGKDVDEQDGIAVMRLTPDAGTIKNRKVRSVPLHAHLIEQGFLEWVRARGAGPLFYRPRSAEQARQATNPKKSPAAQVRQRIAAWVRSIGVKDRGVSPNHAWRHTFKQTAERNGIGERMHDYITGHAPANVSRGYGPPTLGDMAEALKRFPRYLTATYDGIDTEAA